MTPRNAPANLSMFEQPCRSLKLKSELHPSPGTPFRRDAIKDISIKIDNGDFIGIIGHTGSGKSTLVQHLNGLLRPASTGFPQRQRYLRHPKRYASAPSRACFNTPSTSTDFPHIRISPSAVKRGLGPDEIDASGAPQFVGLREALQILRAFGRNAAGHRRVMAMLPGF